MLELIDIKEVIGMIDIRSNFGDVSYEKNRDLHQTNCRLYECWKNIKYINIKNW